MTPPYLRSIDDIREEQEAILERELDPDMAMASDYVSGALDDAQAAAVRARIARDPAFADLVEPLFIAARHEASAGRITPAERQQKYLELRRRIGMPDALPLAPDNTRIAFASEMRDHRRRERRKHAYLFAAILAMTLVMPALYSVVKWWRNDVGLYNRVAWGATQTVPLLGGATVTLASGTRLVKVADYGSAQRLVFLTGEGTFDVPPGSTLPPLEIQTQSAVVTVRGTRFTVSAYEWAPTVVTVERGVVEVVGRDAEGDRMSGPAVQLRAGQRLRAVRGMPPQVLP